jgi:hypothetical protein
MYPQFDVSKDNTNESKCFIDTQGKIYCNGTTYFNVQETVACPERMCQVQRKVECHGQERCQITKERLSISKNDQLFDRFVKEKETWK